MRPSHDDEEFFHTIIREVTQHEGSFEHDAPGDGCSHYLTDTGDGYAEQPEIDEEDGWCRGIWNSAYINMI